MACAWEKSMIPMLRIFLNDPDEETYSDTRLKQLLAIGAHYVIQEISGLSNSYTIDILQSSISPDPVALGDTAFINFTVLKATCIADINTFRSKALIAGIKARCGPAVMETMQHLAGFSELIKNGPCASYDRLRIEYAMGNVNVVKAVLGPFISNDYNPEFLRSF